jgi:hypothetical protein
MGSFKFQVPSSKSKAERADRSEAMLGTAGFDLELGTWNLELCPAVPEVS